ncbi:Uncharacterised protein [Kluyvera cryocrescens]|uniref:Uncharacterized protein n=1 Tax=Kluyvera cryocrescens TaxID=580 RepID=A0A485BRY0_KLUCR|nr:Uncharacterised protein [Kluyvera cryocrescens]
MIEELHDTIDLGVEFALADVHTIVVAKITEVNDTTIGVQTRYQSRCEGQ